MVEITVTYIGNTNAIAQHGPSGTILRTTAPVDNGGTGDSFSPTDLLATSLAACMTTYLGFVDDRHGLQLKGSRVIVKKEMTADPLRRIASLTVDVYLQAWLDDKMVTVLNNAFASCPVRLSISERVKVNLQIHQPNMDSADLTS